MAPAIPKGLSHLAQGCEERATLGQMAKSFYPNGVADGFKGRLAVEFVVKNPQPALGLMEFRPKVTQGSEVDQSDSDLATLGFESESLWDSSADDPIGNSCETDNPFTEAD